MKITITNTNVTIDNNGIYTSPINTISYTSPSDKSGVTFILANGKTLTAPTKSIEVNGVQMNEDNIEILLAPIFFLGENISISDVTGLLEALSKKADLVGGLIPSFQLPSYVDDIIEGELVNDTEFDVEGFIIVPENGKIYIDTVENKTYRWSGSIFVEISKSIGLGSTVHTAFRGDYGQIAYDHSKTIGNPHNTTKADIGLNNIDNTSDIDKPVSKAQQSAITSAISAIKIGGRNLIPNSANIDVVNIIGQGANRTITVDLVKGDTYTLSYKSTTLTVANDYPQFYIWKLNDWTNLQSLGTIENKSRTFVWNRPTGAYTFTVYNHNYAQGGSIVELKLEKGTKATDWSAAPEDIQNQIKVLSDRITALGG